MTDLERCERVARLLALRLEQVALVVERSPAGSRSQALLDGAVAATRRAIALELVSRDRADAIWASVEERHPLVRRRVPTRS